MFYSRTHDHISRLLNLTLSALLISMCGNPKAGVFFFTFAFCPRKDYQKTVQGNVTARFTFSRWRGTPYTAGFCARQRAASERH